MNEVASNAVTLAQRNQIAAADPAATVFVTANAGSGKTSTLVNRVARLLLKGVDPGAVLCVTYTKAAAAEMQTRLFEQLGRWAVLKDSDLRGALAKLDDGDPDALSDQALSRARQLFAGALETPGGLKIQTIHAFCEKLLRRFPIEAGVSPRFTVLEDEAAKALSLGAREDLARAAADDPEGAVGAAYAHFAVALDWGRFNDLLSLIESQRIALIQHVERIDAGLAPDPWAAAGAVRDVTPQAIEAAFVARLDAAAWRAAAEGMATGSANDQIMAGRMRAAQPPGADFAALEPVFLDSKGQPRGKLGTKSAPPGAVTFLAETQGAYLAVLDRVRAARVADETVKVLTLARVHAAFYELRKARRGALDFPDLVARTAELLTRRANAAWVLYKLDGGIDHILIDEAQDTAPDQWDIVRALTEEIFAGTDDSRTLFAVGDEKQSIYSFQGARPERLLQEAQRYEAMAHGAERRFAQVPLETSFRSTPQVLDFVDAVFAMPERARALTPDRGDLIHHVAARGGHSGCVEIVDLFRDEKPPEPDAWDAPVDQEGAASARKRLAERLAADIRRQIAEGVAVHDKAGHLRPCGPGDFLVLVRRRDATFEEILRALKAQGLPVAGADRLKLKEHIVFDDLVALARFALYPDDDLSLAEILRGPLCDVDEDSLFDLAGREGRGGLWRELRERAEERTEWAAARDLVQAVIEARGRDPFAFFCGLLNRVDVTGRSGRGRILARLGADAAEAVDETLAQVIAAEDRGAADLETCLARLEAAEVEVKRELDQARGQVRVMTVHGAKGLEAPIVILPDTTSRAKAQGPSLMQGPDGGWLMCPGGKGEDCPASAELRRLRDERTEAETLRLLYVALTRARDRIVIMGRAGVRGPDEGSWWTVLSETFDRLGDRVREAAPGLRRFGPDPAIVAAAPEAAPPAPTAAPDWARRPAPVDRGSRLASPSQLGEVRRIPAPSPLDRSGPGGALGRFRRGDLIHRLLERLPEAPRDTWPELAPRLLAREGDLDEAQRAEMIAAALGVLDDARFAPVFGPGSRPEVALTGGAEALPAGVVVSGRIDRLVVAPDRVLIVDYKTNRPAPDRIEDADPSYVLQLAVYRAVLRRLYPDRPVEAALVWTDGPKLMPVPAAMMEAALAATMAAAR
ncbi:MAG: double-strand break repair helicase AddA [Brevundimonas sp.]|uniref:double-strand break repair helicase AddA n=1 Tax=Brevundimonas sp. TaxID=1871086 RepID=UPI0025C68F95|nr:double-strand break repair helicase AddA [Brevundimonas sp.]MBX3478008.1 double-strand break repair helicase AddA [Brevundimonas sp.]